MAGLSRSLEHVRDRYDVIVVGSGYGGGVAASRLVARRQSGRGTGARSRGRHRRIPQPLPRLKNEMQVTGKRLRTGPTRPLRRAARRRHARARRLRARRRIAHQRRRGAAPRRARLRRSIAGPARSPRTDFSMRAFAAPTRWLRPQRDPRAGGLSKYKALEAAGSALGYDTVAPTVAVSFDPNVNPPASSSRPARAAATAARAATSAPRTPSRSPICRTPCATARSCSRTPACARRQGCRRRLGGARASASMRNGGVAADLVLRAPMVVLAAGTLGSTEILLRSRANGLPLSDRIGAALLRQRRHHRLRLWRERAGQRRRRRLSGQDRGRGSRRLPSPGSSRSTTRRTSPTSCACRKACCRRRWRRCCR